MERAWRAGGGISSDCGDRTRDATEACDDGNQADGDGCAADCMMIEAGYRCPTVGVLCVAIVCGDSRIDLPETCDDGNGTPFDGCDATCRNEPDCEGGVCQAVCGDGVILPGTSEACDDGNTNDGDGCSSSCQEEEGFECVLSPVDLGDELSIPVIYRDFRSNDTADPSPTTFSLDFNNPDDSNGSIAFRITTDQLDADGKPELSGDNPYVYGSNEGPPHSAASFAQWYRTSPALDPTGNLEVVGELVLPNIGANVYEFDSLDFPPGFFPLDDPALAPFGWPAEPMYGETLFIPSGGSDLRNFGFTTEVHYFFVYQGDEVLTFSGDDDLWVFVDGFLCLDVGGLHPRVTDVMSFADPADAGSATQEAVVNACKARLEEDRAAAPPGQPLVYEVAIFHAERHTGASNFRLTLDGFVTEISTCDYSCGDGIATRFEFCDDGPGQNTGAYGQCLPDCSGLGPYCGDGNVDAGFEECDDGDNLGGSGGCNPDCTSGPTCGDGIRQPELGEGCDAGPDNGVPGSGCSATCEVVVE
ncbi:MAG: DUF4215 domain-containing protein [Deltaproteobacteria bacterium]|nr:DUF4215 domain-containing protein [Deltaproteobacteria bacterium]